MATIIDVAKKAGVSISTVSYVLSGVRPVSEKTRCIVEQAMAELGYHPHALARALASKRTNMIAFVFPPGNRGFGSTELSLITDAVKVIGELGFNMVLWTCDFNDQKELARLVHQGIVDGLVLLEVYENDKRAEFLANSGLPHVLIGRTNKTDQLCIDIDFNKSFDAAVEYLISQGHRNVAFVNQSKMSWESGYGPARRAKQAFKIAVKKYSINGEHVFCEPNPKAGFASIHKLRTKEPGLTALLVMNDRALPGVIQKLDNEHMAMPRDISLITMVSSAELANSFVTPLTALEIPSLQLIENSVRLLIDSISVQRKKTLTKPVKGKTEILIPCTLEVRSSTALVN